MRCASVRAVAGRREDACHARVVAAATARCRPPAARRQPPADGERCRRRLSTPAPRRAAAHNPKPRPWAAGSSAYHSGYSSRLCSRSSAPSPRPLRSVQRPARRPSAAGAPGAPQRAQQQAPAPAQPAAGPVPTASCSGRLWAWSKKATGPARERRQRPGQVELAEAHARPRLLRGSAPACWTRCRSASPTCRLRPAAPRRRRRGG